jgi:hypothetical protein
MDDGSMYILQDIAGKGKGLIATKNIAKGTRILSEHPVVTIPEGRHSDAWLKRHISEQVESLDDDEQRSFLSLHNLVGRECTAMNFPDRVLRYVDERIQLYNRQGPDNPSLPMAYLDAAQIAIANSDFARGRIFAERVVEEWRIA